MKPCKNHPDREAVQPYRMCAECLAETKKRLQKKYSANLKENWTEVNLADLLDDAKSGRLNTTQLSKRYRIDSGTVISICKKYGVILKKAHTGKRHCEFDTWARGIPDMSLACGTIYPKHL